ncbi:MAG: DUF4339 domain-containing protein [Bdellovibrionota bacterium]
MEQKEWFLYVVDHHEGPFTASEVKELVNKGEALPNSFVWREGYADWVMMSDAKEFGSGGPKSDGHGVPSFNVSVPANAPKKVTPVQTQTSVSMNLDENAWCLNSRKKFSGPFSLKSIASMVADGEASLKDSVWREGLTKFLTLSDIPEVVAQVEADKVEGKKEKKGFFGKAKREKASSASALGLTGASKTRQKNKFKLGFVSKLVVLGVLVATYHFASQGRFDSLIGRSLGLPPLPMDLFTKEIKPHYYKAVALLPEPAKAFLSPVALPEGLTAEDSSLLREAALADATLGIRFASALPSGEELNPSFVLASNAPDGTQVEITLRGKEGTLLNATGYEKTSAAQFLKGVAQTSKFVFEDGKPLPKGEYTLAITRRGQPEPQVVREYFLGGKRDAAYATRLNEFNERIRARKSEELGLLRQLTETLDSMANESATKFQSLAKVSAVRKRKSQWNQYHVKYSQMSNQIRSVIAKTADGSARATLFFPDLHTQAAKAFEFTEQLHQLQTQYLEKGGKIEFVTESAAYTLNALNALKEAVTKVNQ